MSQILNVGRETLVMEFSMIQNISESVRRSFGVNLICGETNAVELCQKTRKGVSLDCMLESYMNRDKVA